MNLHLGRCAANTNKFGIMVAIAITALSGSGCLRKSKSDSDLAKSSIAPTVNRCVALRGNGTHMIAHTTALARITNRWGEIHAIAGGSSATITTFLYESILMNPAVKSLPDAEKAKAISLLLKSLTGFAAETAAEPEWRALRSLGVMASRIQEKGTLALPASEYRKASEDLRAVLDSEDIRDLVNPEILAMLTPSLNPQSREFAAKVEEVKKAAASLTNLDASDPDVFVRVGILNFPHFIGLIGRVANFYAGYGAPQIEMRDFIKDCTQGTDDQLWSAISPKATSKGTCGERFSRMVRSWKQDSKTLSGTQSRLADQQGQTLRSIMITSVIENPEVIGIIKKYDQDFKSDASRSLSMKFDDVKFGYWVSSSFSGDPIKSWQTNNPDAKSKKAVNLGSAKTWRDILEKSPLEPSLGKYQEFSSSESHAGAISLGGWADLHPVQILKAAGCDKVIYLTRRSEETSFITKGPPFGERKPSGLAEMLGMTNKDYNDIYNLQDQNSAFSKALQQSDGVWCTSWNNFDAMQQDGIANDGWSSPLLTKDKELSKWPEADSSGQPILGCR